MNAQPTSVLLNSNLCALFFFILLHLSSVEDLKSKFCSTVANDIMLVSTLGVVRMWADEASRKSRFRILFTTYQERKTQLISTPTEALFAIQKMLQNEPPTEGNGLAFFNETTTMNATSASK